MFILNPCKESSEAPQVCDTLWVLSLLSPGKPAELQRKESTDRHPFQHGDKVKCLLDIDILREMQEGHGGWNPKMAEVCPWVLPGCNSSLSLLLHCSGSYQNIFV